MLVLTQRVGQRIVIGEREIEISVRKIQKNGKVVLGIKAPKEVKIKTGEPMATSK